MQVTIAIIVLNKAVKKEKKAIPPLPSEAALANITQPLASAKSAILQIRKKIDAKKDNR